MSIGQKDETLDRLSSLAGDVWRSGVVRDSDVLAEIAPAGLLRWMEQLRDDEALQFRMLLDLTAVDRSEGPMRYQLVYNLYSTNLHQRLLIKLGVDDTSHEVDSVASLWPSANWLEREVFDLYGIGFRGHPALSRLLLDEEFSGHPLRKDFRPDDAASSPVASS